MDNQQAKTSDISWLAGFMDGEGCFSFQPNHVRYLGKPYTFWYPRIRIDNTHIETLNDITFILGEMGVGYNVSWRHPANVKWKTSWDIAIAGMKRVEKLLQIISPYLKTKAEHSKRIQAWIQIRQGHKPGNQHKKYAPYSEQELQLMNEVKAMNH